MPIDRPRIVRERCLAGAMSGTSADGVDVAIIRTIPPRRAELLALASVPFAPALRSKIIETRSAGACSLRTACEIGRAVSLAYVECVRLALRQAGLDASQLDAVGAHGQTLFHDPPLTLQVFDPSLLAIETGCAVVSDFRRADLALGGQGAPLVPFADAILFAHASRTRAIANLGGIANVTVLRPATPSADIRAFDTGPGNCVSDHLARTLDPAGPGYDLAGARAARGAVDDALLAQLLADPYFVKPPPKSTDGPAMLAIWGRALAAREIDADDRFATAAAWSGDALANAIPRDADLFVAGGGTKNAAIMARLRSRFPSLMLTDDLGVPSAAREAIAFALLAAATLDGVPGNVPDVTGASRAVVLGSITQPTGRTSAPRVSGDQAMP